MRKKPLRKCVSCGEKKEKRSLSRIVNNKDKGIVIDLTGKINGRGAYICKTKECYDRAVKNNLLKRSLRSDIPEEIYKELRNLIKEID